MVPDKRKFLAALAILGGVGILLAGPLNRPSSTTLQASGKTLTVPIAKLVRGAAQVFSYRDDGGKKLRFILARDSEGNVHGIFDACRQCYEYDEGYGLLNDGVVCRLCGNRYSFENMAAGKATCVPVPLAYEVSADEVHVRVDDLEAGRWLF